MTALKPGFTYTPAQTLLHAGDMRLIDEVVGYEAEAVHCRVRVRRDSPFCEADGVPAWVGVEYMAQAMGVYSGIELLQRGEPLRIGFLIGTRRYEAVVPVFAIGMDLEISARVVLWEKDNLFAFDCAIHESGRKLAWGEIKAFRPEDVQKFLKEDPSPRSG
jgi:predicted hotdog family 3-hydroxylacyl-ACP dehydratase